MSQQLQMPKLTTRTVKGSALSQAEVDANWNTIKNFMNAVASFFGTALNTDGTLKAGSVTTTALGSRVVGPANIMLNFLPFVLDTGSPGAYAVANVPALTQYSNGLVFFIKAGNNNSGATTLNVDGLGAVPIQKGNGLPLVANDIVQGQLFCVAYYAGVFQLLQPDQTGGGSGSGGSSGNGSGFSGQTVYAPAAFALPGANLSVTLAHAMGATPTGYRAWLICNSAELGYSVGDQVPIEEVTDGAHNPAFGVQLEPINIVLTQFVSPPQIPTLVASAGTLTAITPANWSIIVIATLSTSSTVNLFPALDIEVSNPDGAYCYGTNLFYANLGKHSANTFLNYIDLTTGVVTKLDNAPAVPHYHFLNVAPYRSTTHGNQLLFTADVGLFRLPLDNPGGAWTKVQFAGSNMKDWNTYKPAWIDEATNGPDNPIVYAVQSGAGSSTTLAMRKLDVLANTAVDYPFNGSGGTKMSLHNAGIVGGAAFTAYHSVASTVLLFQYNPVKKRIYVITDETGLMHIFNLSLMSGDLKAWWLSGDYTKLTYEKAMALGGGAGMWADPSRDRYSVEFDLVTGQEKSVCCTRLMSAGNTGIITRVPWPSGV